MINTKVMGGKSDRVRIIVNSGYDEIEKILINHGCKENDSFIVGSPLSVCASQIRPVVKVGNLNEAIKIIIRIIDFDGDIITINNKKLNGYVDWIIKR